MADEHDERTKAAHRFNELSPKVQEMLSGLKSEEVDTLEYLSTIPKEEARGMMKMYRDVRAVGKFFTWLIVGVVGMFIGAVSVGESVMKFIAWLKPGGPP